MNKQDLISFIAESAGLPKTKASEALQAIQEGITSELKKKEGEVSILGFGKFSIKDRPARTGRNPKDGSPLKIKASRQVQFKPGKELKDAVNK